MASTFSTASLKTRALNRYKSGMARVREGFFQSLQIVISGIGAYVFAEKVLGHHEPIFAATAAIVSLGYVRGATHARRMLEVTLGVTLGVFIGDMLMLALGQGIWQAALVLFISILLARFLDNGLLFTIQMGLQSTLVVLMTPTAHGPFARSLDAIVGGSFAFLLMFLLPKDPRTLLRSSAITLMDAYSRVLREAATAMRDYDAAQGWQSLESARGLQPLYNAVEGEYITAKGMAQLSMIGRNHTEELVRFSQALKGVDLGIRSTRVLVRRMASTMSHVQLSSSAILAISSVLEWLSEIVLVLGESMYASGAEVRAQKRLLAREELTRLAQKLDPGMMGVRTLEGESLVLMIRPLVIDLLEVTGLSHDEAAAALVPLGESMTVHAPRTSQISTVEQKPKVSLAADEDRLAPDDTRALNIVLRSQQKKD